MAKIDKVKEEIGWLKFLLAMVFTVWLALTGWIIGWVVEKGPPIPEHADLWTVLRLIGEGLGLWQEIALWMSASLYFLMLVSGIGIGSRINKLGEIDGNSR